MKLNKFKFTLLIFCVNILPWHASLSMDEWSNECECFTETKLKKNLRSTRSNPKRSEIPFTLAYEILNFIEKGKEKHGTKIISSSDHTVELIIDVCDIVNLQHPNFKKRFDIFIEQWDNDKQLPFSLFSFDRIAQVFHYRQTLFNLCNESAYQQVLEKIIGNEILFLRDTFSLIHNLQTQKQGNFIYSDENRSYSESLKNVNVFLDQMVLASASEKATSQKEIRKVFPATRMKYLYSLSAMAHDYLTLDRFEKAVKVILDIPEFIDPSQKEAFLAGMIQIGELATNKNLSHFVRYHMPTIPWNELVHCRDAIEHQDEHGYDAYFSSLVDGSNMSINFIEWQKELEILIKRVSKAKDTIWKDNPKAIFEMWLEGELKKKPIYGVLNTFITPTTMQVKYYWFLRQIPFPNDISYSILCLYGNSIESIEKSVQKIFRDTPLFNKSSRLWTSFNNGKAKVTPEYFAELQAGIKALEEIIPTIPDFPKKSKKKREKAIKFLESYKEIENYHSNNVPLKESKTIFQQTPVYSKSLDLWRRLYSGQTKIASSHLEELRAEIKEQQDIVQSPLTESKERTKAEKNLKSYQDIEAYLWDRLKCEAVHLNNNDKNLLIHTAKDFFNVPNVRNFCIALLNMDQLFLTENNIYSFLNAGIQEGLTCGPILSIASAFKPEMSITRQLYHHLPPDHSKDLEQLARKQLADRMFNRTTSHLHDLTHKDGFCERLYGQMVANIYEHAFQQGLKNEKNAIRKKYKKLEKKRNELYQTHGYIDQYGFCELNQEGNKLWINSFKNTGINFNFSEMVENTKTNEFLEYHNKAINKLYQGTHTLYLSDEINKNPVIYLASVYSLSVGLGALNSWVSKEAYPSENEVKTVETLRYGKNFIAHGDLFRNMHEIDLRDIQKSLLMNHLDHCVLLKLTDSDKNSYNGNL